MAFSNQMHAQFFGRQNPLTVDTVNAQKFFDEDDSGILDDGILEHSAVDSGLELSPPMAGSRRDSFAVSSTLFSPKTEDWQSVDMQSLPSNNPFLEPQHTNNNPFTRGDHTAATYAPQSQAWSIGQGSGTCTPFQYDGLDATYDANTALFQQRPMHVQTPFGNPGAQVAALFSNVSNHTIPTSPQKDWMGQDLKNQSMKRPRPSSPNGIRSHNELRRGDGIRKKNARFDIPAERNLTNIDQLIASSTDEQEVKELKQQKRLLRNRQAALDSRQRKKLHTERLEDEKKHYTGVINGMEEEIAELNMKLDQLFRENQSLKNHIDVVVMEKEEMVQQHTMETGDLRKKVSVLTDHVQRLESNALNGNGFDNGFNEMESMPMDGPWDNMNFIGEYPAEQESKPEMHMVPVKKTEVTLPAQLDKPANQGGLLFMLFLVGAFVLSNRSTPQIPKVSEDVRAASESLLNDVLKDAALSQGPDQIMAMAPQPSGASWATPSTMPGANMMDGVAPSMLGAMADSLTQPTEQQSNEQLFGLTPAQYNAVQDQSFIRPPPSRTTSEGRRNLAETLAAMRNNDKSTAADVYTRSLLWDQIPRDVVRNFAKMMVESNTASRNQPHETNA